MDLRALAPSANGPPKKRRETPLRRVGVVQQQLAADLRPLARVSNRQLAWRPAGRLLGQRDSIGPLHCGRIVRRFAAGRPLESSATDQSQAQAEPSQLNFVTLCVLGREPEFIGRIISAARPASRSESLPFVAP